MKKLLTTILLLSLIHSAFSQSTAKEQKIKEFLELTGSGKLGVQVSQQMLTSFQMQYASVPAEFWQKVREEIKAADLITMVIPVYAKHFTEDDIDQLVKFYKTPIGQKLIAATPEITTEAMQAGREWGEKITKKVLDELKEKGYMK